MINQEIIEFYHKHHNRIEKVIESIISFYGDIDNKYYEITSVDAVYKGLNIKVSHYINGWGDEYFDKFIPLSLLYDQDQYNDLESKAEENVVKRNQLKNEKEEIELQKKLDEAKAFLEKHSNIV
jgi:hypothetical protein